MMNALLLPAINLAMLLGILVKFLRAPLKQFVADRSAKIEKDLVETAEQKASAEAKKKEISAKLSSVDLEVGKLSKEFEAEARATAEQLISKANTLAAQIKKDAFLSAQSATDDLKAELISEFGLMLVSKIEAGVQKELTKDDRQNFRKAFTKLVGAEQ